ncbi:uncharacterized protein J3D65DRAFT_635103 [Phyllosticta citribraziliensis]|uniref:SnoaL-like domain-containing protein n=1 Tax=Phyllosticta citribraziliensis TaxID=989973 RepID=A0ABR1LDJ6_9PEZI
MKCQSIFDAATLFAHSYNASMEVYRSGAPVSVFANTLAQYYKADSFNGYFIGHSSPGINTSSIAAGTEKSVNFLNKQGVGHDLVMTHLRVEPVSEGSAAVWIVWKICPRDGQESWEWETLYGYRRDVNMTEQVASKRSESQLHLSDCEEQDVETIESAEGRPDGWWEYTITDNEIYSFAQRVPNYLSSYS